MALSHPEIVRIVTLLETHLEISFRLGLYGMLFFASWFLLYVVIGLVAGFVGLLNPPYPFLSLEADPFFVIGGAITGLFTVQSAGSFVLYHFLVGVEDDRSQFAVLMGFISLGFGGALLRVTLPTAIQLLSKIL
jgi:hypothetical protein